MAMIVTWENQPWAEAYRLAVLEVDRSARLGRIQEAKSIIHARIKELADAEVGKTELIALNDALVMLRAREVA
jgi:hypothetical protein